MLLKHMLVKDYLRGNNKQTVIGVYIPWEYDIAWIFPWQRRFRDESNKIGLYWVDGAVFHTLKGAREWTGFLSGVKTGMKLGV